MPVSQKIGFIGAGQMAEALARGFIDKGVITADQVLCTDVNAERNQVFESFGAKSFTSPKEVRPSCCARPPGAAMRPPQSALPKRPSLGDFFAVQLQSCTVPRLCSHGCGARAGSCRQAVVRTSDAMGVSRTHFVLTSGTELLHARSSS